MTALTITHHIAAPLEVIDAALGLKAQNLTQAIKVLDVVDAATFEAGNRLLIDSHQALKDLEAARVKLKKPITELGKAIDSVVAKVADPLEAAKKSMQGKVAAHQRAEQEKAAKAQREAEEKARIEREAAEQERARLQAIADAKHAAEVAAAQAKAEAEAKELEAVLGKPVEVKVADVAPAPKIAAFVPAPTPPITAAPVKAAAIQTRRVKKVVIDDERAVPAYVGGECLRPIDSGAVRRALEAGIAVAGCRIVEVEEVGMARARS
jgi:DNA polymerase III gamma/tau subunit